MPEQESRRNVLGGQLAACSSGDHDTCFYRDGCCATGPDDHGRHVVCAVVTEEFLAYSLSRGNDLITPHPAFAFPGLKPGDRWCLCVSRWREAFEAGVAPSVILEATHDAALREVSLQDLEAHAHPLQ
ncbi:MAG: DUF2237 domain-containing protein [Planctomycetota bacterium]